MATKPAPKLGTKRTVKARGAKGAHCTMVIEYVGKTRAKLTGWRIVPGSRRCGVR